jgi:hypothetical protein
MVRVSALIQSLVWMDETPNSSVGLPIRGSLTAVCALTLLIAVLMTAASVEGIVHSRSVYPTEELRRMFLANDVANLCVGLPFLLIPLILALRRSSLACFS